MRDPVDAEDVLLSVAWGFTPQDMTIQIQTNRTKQKTRRISGGFSYFSVLETQYFVLEILAQGRQELAIRAGLREAAEHQLRALAAT